LDLDITSKLARNKLRVDFATKPIKFVICTFCCLKAELFKWTIHVESFYSDITLMLARNKLRVDFANSKIKFVKCNFVVCKLSFSNESFTLSDFIQSQPLYHMIISTGVYHLQIKIWKLILIMIRFQLKKNIWIFYLFRNNL
jgi:hypothetical protein